MSDWHYQHNGETKGPVDDGQLKALADAGVINAGTPVWKTGYSQWIPLSQSDFPYLASVAPAPTAGAGGAALHPGGQMWGTNDVVVDNRGMWQMFTDAITKNYAKFTGRARRKEYWSFILFYIIFAILFAVIGLAIDAAIGNIGGSRRSEAIVTMVVVALWVLAMIIPSIAVGVRRLHDLGFTGWLYLINFIPYVGSIAFLVMMLIPTRFGPNKHGPAPKAPNV